jgi:outer membrane protein insertion porin family
MGIRIVTCVVVFFSLLIPFLPVSARNTSETDLWNKPVKYIRIESDASISAEYIFQAISIRENDPLTPDALRNSLKKLNLLRRFQSISVFGEPFQDGCALIFKVEPAWMIQNVKFKGGAISALFSYGLGGKFSPKTLQRQIQVFRGDIYSKDKGQAAIEALKDFYFNNGYAESTVSLDPIFHDSDATVDLVFTVNQGRPTSIRDVQFTGHTSYHDDILLKQTGLSKKKMFSRKRLNSAREKLEKFYRRQGYLNVQVFRPEIQFDRDSNSALVRFKITENDPIHIRVQADVRSWNLLWKFYALEKRPDLYLELLGIEESGKLDSDRFREGVKHLERRYWNKGYLNADIRLSEFPNESGRTVYSYKIEENEPVTVDTIIVAGNESFSIADFLSNEIIQTQTGKRYNHDSFMADADSLREWYLTHGFHKSRITAEYTISPEDTTVTLYFLIEEGPRFFWDTISIDGNSAFSDAHLLELLQLASGTPFDSTAVNTGIDLLTDYYLSHGYPDVSISWVITQAESTTPSLEITIDEGVQAVIDAVIIRGYEKTLRSVIDRSLPVLVGQPFYYKTLLDSERQLIRTNLFRSVEISNPPWESSQPGRTLLIDVKEQPFIFLEGGPGYNSDRGFNGYLSLYTTNLGGSNRYLGISGLLSEKDYKGNIIFREPEFANLPVQLELRLLTEETTEKDYNLRRRGSRATWSYSMTPLFRMLLMYRFDSDEPYDIGLQADIPEEFRHSVKIGSLSPGFLYDSRDDPQSPRTGSLFSAKVEFARTMYSSEVHFTKITTETTHFFDLSRYGVFGASVRMGWAYDLPYQEEFRLGGIKSIRGWDFDAIRKHSGTGGDSIISSDNRDIDVSVLANIEYRYPIAWGLQGVVFFDTGNVFDDYKDVSFSNLKGTLGLGIRFMTPVGPVGVDYGYNILKTSSDPSSRWSFVIGHTF